MSKQEHEQQLEQHNLKEIVTGTGNRLTAATLPSAAAELGRPGKPILRPEEEENGLTALGNSVGDRVEVLWPGKQQAAKVLHVHDSGATWTCGLRC